MARVSRKAVSVLARHAPSRAIRRNTRKHKVILESITQEKKKLRSVISFEAKAPPGYTFIPAGNPQLTTACKELCRKDGWKVFAVTTTPHMHTHNLSQHVHRIGYHFPSTAVATVCMDMGLYLTAAGKAVPFQSVGSIASRRRANSEVSQTTINTEARDVLKDLFPNMPDNDLNQIIKTAFQKGQRKVGTAVELPLARRAQLAVVAHIRHIYTDYDRLLKATSFHEARSLVEEPTLAKLVEWRGDDENGRTVLEDVFREVIVISDDEEDSDTEGEAPASVDRDRSVMVVSSNPRADELQTKQLNYANPILREVQSDISDDEAPPGFRFIPEAPRTNKIDRRGFSRYQAWDRAINRYRHMANEADQRRLHDGSTDSRRPVVTRQPLQENVGQEGPALYPAIDHPCVSLAPLAASNTGPFGAGAGRPILTSVVDRHSYELNRGAELSIDRRDILLSNVIPLDRTQAAPPKRRTFQRDDSPNAPVFVSGPREVYEMTQTGDPTLPLAPSQHRSTVQSQDHAFPSIEAPLPVEIRRSDSGQLDHLTKRMSGTFSIRSVTPHHLAHREASHQDLQKSARDQAAKRRRTAHYEPVGADYTYSKDNSASTVVPHRAGWFHNAAGYVPWGSSSALDETYVRRGYVAPFGALNTPENHPGRSQSSAVTANIGLNTEAAQHQVPVKKLDNQTSHLLSSEFPARRWSPGQPHIFPGNRYAIYKDNASERLVPVRHSALEERRVYREIPGYNIRNLRPVQGPESQESIWSSRIYGRTPASHARSPKRHYAEDFVRAVDYDDRIPLEYTAQHQLQTPNRSMGTRPQPVGVTVQTESYQCNISGSMESRPSGPVCLDSRAEITAQDFAAALDQSQGYQTVREINPSSTAQYYDRYGGGTMDFSWQASECQQQGSGTGDQCYPTYVRQVNRTQYSVPEGRAVVIVD
ncbi:hypothetical protein BO70DRAFT_315045 [Aspergillus heteromorphus CBS 117.55]|uniref:DUF2293 domain-containing protein n=1 Tax=Aspergillus heteromorphus CBS 117.55 TaxID=1448321 RepID=A0A317W554_9EURO|nr:uncharacterized protein BO70DRAFT_315045 [Aspergillus heteromorphus CBS 117.55]PWY81776.1 hypothetical protein BO70DRAFT_315045 [Aspergillus heteromorphus CBS 117.55]